MHSRLWLVSAIVVITIANLGFGIGSSTAASRDGCSEGLPSSTGLSAVTIAPHSHHAWAVGTNGLILRRTNGWHQVADAGGSAITFKGVAATSARSVWAVGFSRGPTCQAVPVIEHSSGGGFRRVRLRDVGYAALTSVSASARNNVWAVGETNRSQVVVLHFNGRDWRRISVAGVLKRATAYDVSTSGPRNVWIVAGFGQFEALHFDGEAWHLIKFPDPGDVGIELTSVATTSADQVWLAGSTIDPPKYSSHTLVLKRTQSGWVRMHTPNPTSTSSVLGIAAQNGQVVAVGEADANASHPFVLRLANDRWHRMQVVNVERNSWLSDVAISGRRMAAVGSWDQQEHDGDISHPVIEIPSNGGWRPVRTTVG